MSESPPLLVRRDGPVATVTMNRPERHNAFDEALIEALTEAFGALGEDAAVRAIVLEGAGASFSAGADVNWMRRAAGYGEEENRADARRLAAMLRTIDECPKPVVARVQGAALGQGERTERADQRPTVLGARGRQGPPAGFEVELTDREPADLGPPSAGQDQEPDDCSRLRRQRRAGTPDRDELFVEKGPLAGRGRGRERGGGAARQRRAFDPAGGFGVGEEGRDDAQQQRGRDRRTGPALSFHERRPIGAAGLGERPGAECRHDLAGGDPGHLAGVASRPTAGFGVLPLLEAVGDGRRGATGFAFGPGGPLLGDRVGASVDVGEDRERALPGLGEPDRRIGAERDIGAFAVAGPGADRPDHRAGGDAQSQARHAGVVDFDPTIGRRSEGAEKDVGEFAPHRRPRRDPLWRRDEPGGREIWGPYGVRKSRDARLRQAMWRYVGT